MSKGGEESMMRKSVRPVMIATFIGVSTLVTKMPAFAQTPTPTQTKVNFFDGLVKYLADTFHLDQTQVKSAITTYHSQHKADMQQIRDDHMKTRLDQLVKDGKITQEQENAILAELNTLKSKYSPESMKDLSKDDRKTKFQQMQTEVQTWAKDHNIDPRYLMPEFGMGMHMKMHRGGWLNAKPSVTPTPTQ